MFFSQDLKEIERHHKMTLMVKLMTLINCNQNLME